MPWASPGNDPLRFLAWVRDDVRAVPGALFQAPPNSAGLFAIAWGGVALRDDEWAESWQRWHRRELWRLVEELGDANAARPAALIIFVGSLLQEDARYQDAAFTSIEALVLANVATNALKLIAGRARPWQADDSHRWKPFSGKTIIPQWACNHGIRTNNALAGVCAASGYMVHCWNSNGYVDLSHHPQISLA